MDRYKFTVQYYDEFENKSTIERGYVIAEDYANAIEKITRYYGQEAEKIYLEPDCDDEIIVLENNIEHFNTEWTGPAINEGW